MGPGVLPRKRKPVGGNGDSTVIRELGINALIATVIAQQLQRT